MTGEDSALAQLAQYKTLIDDDIAAYAAYVRQHTLEQYGQYVLEAETDVFLDLLSRGGKRMRGALVMAGYDMCGGRNQAMIVQAARAVEMLQAYILMIDDIQDRSALRRGQPTAHIALANYHRKHHFKGDAEHAGVSLALGAAVAGAHAAQAILANMDAEPQLKLNVLSIANRTMAITAHGQTLDIVNGLVATPKREDIERVLEWKTALYSLINPLHVGMVLAGAGCQQTDAITPFARHVGIAFQITDDVLGIFGNEQELGKTPGDDIREGKGTLLMVYALHHATPKDRAYLQNCLGRPVTSTELETCRQIVERSGALAHARAEAAKHLDQALAALDAAAGKSLWAQSGTDFLRGLALTLQSRVQ